jgi:cell division transport system permease protein
MTLVHAIAAIVREAMDDLRRAPAVNGVSILVMAVSLTLVGAFLLVSSNLRDVVDRWTAEVRIDLFLLDEATSAERTGLLEDLGAEPLVLGVEEIDRERALAEFQEMFPDLAAVAGEIRENPFPASLRARLVQPPPSEEQLAALAGRFAGRPGVEEVRYDQSWIAKLSSLLDLFSVGALVVGGILALAALFTMSSVIRLNVYARQEEITLQRLVGATSNFIRGPFVAQGMLQGLTGAGIALAVLYAGQTAMARSAGRLGNALLLMAVERPLSTGASLLLVGLGAGIGLVGSVTAVRRFLRV